MSNFLHLSTHVYKAMHVTPWMRLMSPNIFTALYNGTSFDYWIMSWLTCSFEVLRCEKHIDGSTTIVYWFENIWLVIQVIYHLLIHDCAICYFFLFIYLFIFTTGKTECHVAVAEREVKRKITMESRISLW